MNSLNKVTLVGNLGANPKLSTPSIGSKFITFSLATHQSWKDKKGDYQKDTEWHNIVVFNEYLIPFIETSLKKGDLLYIEGQIKSHEWTTNDGQKRTSVSILIPRFGGEVKCLISKAAPDQKEKEAVTVKS